MSPAPLRLIAAARMVVKSPIHERQVMNRTVEGPRPPLAAFTHATAIQKVRLAEDAWNGRDPVRVSLAYTPIVAGATASNFSKAAPRSLHFSNASRRVSSTTVTLPRFDEHHATQPWSWTPSVPGSDTRSTRVQAPVIVEAFDPVNDVELSRGAGLVPE
jgi:uncharacterized protein DUF1348